MRIQHNIMAMNSYRNYNNNTKALAGNLEKLSSGYKINRAGDDAAGLAISEKMRAQITGLEAAQKNVKDGISLVKTGEGAMQEVQDMLKRMKYLATQSSNGTYQDEVDRENLQKEVDALKDEINRIADSANFNGIKLLDGSQQAPSGATTVKTAFANGAMSAVSETAGQKFEQTLQITSGASAATGGKAGTTGKMELTFLDKDGVSRNTTINFTYGSTAAKTAENVAQSLKGVFGQGYNVSVTGDTIKISNPNAEKDLTKILNVDQYSSDGTKLTGNNAADVKAVNAGTDTKFTVDFTAADDPTENNMFEVDGQKFQIVKRGDQVEQGYKAIYTDTGTGNTADSVKQIVEQLNSYGIKAEVNTTKTSIDFIKSNGNDGKGGLTLQIGDTADSFNQMKVVIGDMHAQALGIQSVDISSLTGAQGAVKAITDAINRVSSIRGDLGAVQNRLDHTSNNLSVMAENITDAESTIRDTDVASEMMSYVKNNILVQSAQAMLAQANQV
ncbi:MAG: flagellin, partial [Lawsonibacter sp.]|nr:flagellin [Lawsonibacter sp.]